MKRKIIISEEQFKRLFGEGLEAYLDKSDSGGDFPKDAIGANGEYIKTQDPDGDEQPITNRIANSFINTHPWLRRSTMGAIYESNSDLDGKMVMFNDKMMNVLRNAIAANQNNKTAYGYDRMNNWLRQGGMTYNDAYRTLDDYKRTEYSKNSVIPSELITYLKNNINTATSVSKINKSNSNVFNDTVKTPDVMSGRRGKGHRESANGNKIFWQNS